MGFKILKDGPESSGSAQFLGILPESMMDLQTRPVQNISGDVFTLSYGIFVCSANYDFLFQSNLQEGQECLLHFSDNGWYFTGYEIFTWVGSGYPNWGSGLTHIIKIWKAGGVLFATLLGSVNVDMGYYY